MAHGHKKAGKHHHHKHHEAKTGDPQSPGKSPKTADLKKQRGKTESPNQEANALVLTIQDSPSASKITKAVPALPQKAEAEANADAIPHGLGKILM